MDGVQIPRDISSDIVIIDSLVYVYREDTIKDISDEQIKKAIQSYNASKNDKNGYDNTKGLKLFEANLFVPKKWDYGLSEDFPESIEIKTSGSFAASEVKTKIINAQYFMIGALMSPKNFIIKNEKDIMFNTNDKKVDDAKKKKQLEF